MRLLHCSNRKSLCWYQMPASPSSLSIAYCLQATSLDNNSIAQLERLVNLLLSHENSILALHLDADASADEHQVWKNRAFENVAAQRFLKA